MEKNSINYSRFIFVFMMSLACSVLFFTSNMLAAKLPTAATTKSAVVASVPAVNLDPAITLITTAKTNKSAYETSVANAVASLQTLATTAKPEVDGNNKTKILGLIADNATNLDQVIGDKGASLLPTDLKNKIKTLITDLSAFGKDLRNYLTKWAV